MGGCVLTVVYSVRIICVSYVGIMKYSSFLSFVESGLFFVRRLMLFLFCWLRGGSFYWFFLSDGVYFLKFFDLFIGVVVFFLGVGSFFLIKVLGWLVFLIWRMFFFRWLKRGGTSFSVVSNKLVVYDKSWLELFGGMGFWIILFFS